ncbi:hypothetical protein MANY_46660 [Mycolicibacterium anyangense]|uniref:DUF559 domain-containing protein n=1 Tax=Mycolicibacterium anyangense TaxID=1431246 RepID=A0A6N4WE19_9MYCO|nr:DUF559 domain-containing protein [Mycolicibacterium anyangense]BBZ79329.1 hypothetical protein MANY_46660 [Mycolicibacterium anyangense]
MELIIGSAAVRRGDITRRGLARHYLPVFRDVYLRRDVQMTAQLRARAVWLSTGATVCGLTAAAALGTKWLDPSVPVEILRADRHAAAGMVVRSWTVLPDEVCLVASIRATTPARTAFDIGRLLPQPVPILDALLNATGVSVADVAELARRHPGSRGVAKLRSALERVDGGAESPQESKLRLILVDGGLPVPETQIMFRDLRVRVDMGWREWKVAVEYDGVQHWNDRRQRSWDIERIALLEAAGWAVVRVSAEMMGRPHVIVERVRAKLRAAGCPV